MSSLFVDEPSPLIDFGEDPIEFCSAPFAPPEDDDEAAPCDCMLIVGFSLQNRCVLEFCFSFARILSSKWSELLLLARDAKDPTSTRL